MDCFLNLFFLNRGRFPISIKDITEIQYSKRLIRVTEHRELQKVEILPSLLGYPVLTRQTPKYRALDITINKTSGSSKQAKSETSKQLQTNANNCYSVYNDPRPRFTCLFSACITVVVVVLQQLGLISLLLLAHQLRSNLQHSVDTFNQLFLVYSHIKSCPITHEHTCITDNRSRILDAFFFETSFITAFSNSPTYSTK